MLYNAVQLACTADYGAKGRKNRGRKAGTQCKNKMLRAKITRISNCRMNEESGTTEPLSNRPESLKGTAAFAEHRMIGSPLEV